LEKERFMAVKPIPDTHTSVTPYLIVHGVDRLMGFLERVFGGTASTCMQTPDGKIMHAEVRINGAAIMMGEASEQWPAMPGGVYLYVADVDAAYERALAAGATSVMEPADQFWGDRHGGVKDEWGNVWWIATHIEDVSEEESRRRGEEWMQKAGVG
jgi:PhnB protein